LENDFADTCQGALYLIYEPGMQKHKRFEREPTKELDYEVSDLTTLIYSPTPNVYIVYCKTGTKILLHLNQATKVRIETSCQMKLDKPTIRSDSTVTLTTEPSNYDGSWDPLDMPAVTFKDPGNVNFMLKNLGKIVTKVNEP
jgi:hypothetical protein